MKVENLTVEYQKASLGLDKHAPRISWKLQDNRRNAGQSAYQIQVGRDEKFEDLMWDTGKVLSEQSVQLSYGGPALEKFEKYYCRVRVWDSNDGVTDWCEPAEFEMAMISWKDWEASWITPEYDYTAPKTACPIIRKEFQVRKKVIKARVYVTAKGLYELRLNGEKVGKDFLTPGWTSYNKRTLYQVYDVTDMLLDGANAIGATIGSGWYKGELGWRSRRNLYGGREALILELHLYYEDGTKEKILSDSSWQSSIQVSS